MDSRVVNAGTPAVMQIQVATDIRAESENQVVIEGSLADIPVVVAGIRDAVADTRAEFDS